MIMGLCRMYRALPEAGGLMDQPVWLLAMHSIMAAAGEPPAPPLDDYDDMFAGIPMETL